MGVRFTCKMILFRVLLLLMVLVNYIPVYSADITDSYLNSKPGGNTFDKKGWEKLKNNYKYKTPKVDTTKKKEEEAGNRKPISGGNGWLRLLAYVAIFLVFAGIIYLIARYGLLGNKQFQNNSIVFDINSEPEDINDIVIDPLLAEALKNEDYRLATRLRFLALLQVLNTKELIQWKRERTNLNYVQQLWGNSIQLTFRQLCLIYETVWYGNYLIDKDRYGEVEKKFNLLVQSINKKEYV